MPIVIAIECSGCGTGMDPLHLGIPREDVQHLIRMLEDEAEALKWQRVRRGVYYCPDCVRIRKRSALVAGEG